VDSDVGAGSASSVVFAGAGDQDVVTEAAKQLVVAYAALDATGRSFGLRGERRATYR
jgi:hypothetical protein